MPTFLILPMLFWISSALAPAPAAKRLLCLAANIFFEAGNQAEVVKVAVKEVTINRGGEICITVFKRKQFSWTHQQSWSRIESFLLDRAKLNKLDAKAWEASKAAAVSTMKVLPAGYNAFHATYINPYWSVPGIVLGDVKFMKVKR